MGSGDEVEVLKRRGFRRLIYVPSTFGYYHSRSHVRLTVLRNPKEQQQLQPRYVEARGSFEDTSSQTATRAQTCATKTSASGGQVGEAPETMRAGVAQT